MILDNFWQNIWEGLVKFFQSIANFFLQENEFGLSVLSRILIAIAVLVLGVLLIKLLIFILKRASGIKKGLALDLSAKNFFIEAFKILLYLLLAFTVVAILGINLNGAVGIISAITVALGLALQDIIGMFASGVLIFNTKNFHTGDYIKVVNSFGQEEGRVYKISILYTTLLTVNGQKIHIPNNNITKANLTNFSDYKNRRGCIEITLTYDNDSKLVSETYKEVVVNSPNVLKDPTPSIVIDEFKEIGVKYQIRFYTSIQDYWDTLYELREAILVATKEKGFKIALSTNIQVKEN